MRGSGGLGKDRMGWIGKTALVPGLLLGAIVASAGAEDDPASANAADAYRRAFAGVALEDAERERLASWLKSAEAPPPDAVAMLERHQDALREFAAATAVERCDFGIEYVRGVAASLDHLGPVRDLGLFACLRARLALVDGRWVEAAGDLAACLRLCRHLRADGTALSNFVQASLVGTATRTALLAFDRDLPPAGFCEPLEPLLRGARVDFSGSLGWEAWSSLLTLKWLERRAPEKMAETLELLPPAEPWQQGHPLSDDAARELAAKIGKPAARVAALRSYDDLRALLLEDVPAYAAWLDEVVAAWKLPPREAGEALDRLGKGARAGSAIARQVALPVDSYWRRQQEANARLAILGIVLALAREVRAGRDLPRTWSEVTARLGADVPTDPATGREFGWKVGPDGIQITREIEPDLRVTQSYALVSWPAIYIGSETECDEPLDMGLAGLGRVADDLAVAGLAVFGGFVALFLVSVGLVARRARRDPVRWSLRGNPVFRRELRHRGWAWLVLIFLGGLAVIAEIGGFVWWKSVAPAATGRSPGELLLDLGNGALVLLALAGAPAMVVFAVIGEREGGTGESLVVTGYPREALLFGKLASLLAPLWIPIAVHTLLQPTIEVLDMARTGAPLWIHGWADITARWVSPAAALLLSLGLALAFGAGRARVATGVVAAYLALGVAGVVGLAALVGLLLGAAAIGVAPNRIDLTTWLTAGSILPVAGFAAWAFRRTVRNLERHLGGIVSVLLALLLLVPASPGGAQEPPRDPIAAVRRGHPRLFVTAEGLVALRAAIASDGELAARVANLRAVAAELLRQPPIEYRLDRRGNQLAAARATLHRITTLGLVALLDRDPAITARAREDLLRAASLPTWNPRHFLDVAELTHAVAVGYDWLFDALSAEERTRVRGAIARLGLRESLCFYRSGALITASGFNWALCTHNWNTVCNGGMAVGALAVADEEPDLAREVLVAAGGSIRRSLSAYAPDGGWIEGPGYWRYATEYAVTFFAALETAVGPEAVAPYLATPGLERTGEFAVHAVGPSGECFNFADGREHPPPGDHLLWLARAYRRPLYAWYAKRHPEGSAREILWHAGSVQDPVESGLPVDACFRGAEVAFLRGAWDDPEAIWVGFKGGDNDANHAHLDIGTFVLDAQGVRWALDLGRDDYALRGYFMGGKSKYYRLRTAGHNTLLLDGKDQAVRAKAPITAFGTTADGAWAAADLSEAYALPRGSVRRGVRRVGRGSAIVQDEFDLPRTAEATWQMHTRAEVESRGAVVTLRRQGRELAVRLREPAEGGFDVEPASAPPREAQQPDVRRLVVRLRLPAGKSRIVVVFGPVDAADAGEVTPLATWGGEMGGK